MFEKIDIGIKTFLRDEHLFNATRGITLNYPGARMIIVDDGDMTEEKDGIYADLAREGHIIEVLPFDSGFGKKSNRMVELSTRPYTLIGSDDFVFDEEAAQGLRRLETILDHCDDVHIASGRVNDRSYEFFLDVDHKVSRDGLGYTTIIKEKYTLDRKTISMSSFCHVRDGRQITPWFMDADLTVNYSLIRHEVFDTIRWDDDVKIGGGEHGAFFYDCMQVGFRTVYVPGVNINEQRIPASPRYKTFRARANSPERPCFDKRGISAYILGDGRIDYQRNERKHQNWNTESS